MKLIETKAYVTLMMISIVVIRLLVTRKRQAQAAQRPQ